MTEAEFRKQLEDENRLPDLVEVDEDGTEREPDLEPFDDTIPPYDPKRADPAQN